MSLLSYNIMLNLKHFQTALSDLYLLHTNADNVQTVTSSTF